MIAAACNLAFCKRHILRHFYLMGEEVKRSTDQLIKRLIKVGTGVTHDGWRRNVHWRRLA
ncbi:MAG: hypothetical protein P8182_18395 [Deltaproteobacteria bacterium]